jgi:AsmA protein
MKLIKWLFGILALTVLALILYVTLMFDLNAFKPEIVAAVKKETGRELVISQDISWRFFPSLGIDLGGITVSNPQGFEPMAMVEVKQAIAGVALMPLFSNKVQIDKLVLEGLVINLVKQANGASSLDGLVSETNHNEKTSDADTEKDAPINSSALGNVKELTIGGISISDSRIRLLDEALGTERTIVINKLTLGKFQLGQETDLDFDIALVSDINLLSQGSGILTTDGNTLTIKDLLLNTRLEGDGFPQVIESNVEADVALDLKQKSLELTLNKLSALDIDATGLLTVNYVNPIPKIALELAFDHIVLDPWLGTEDGKTKDNTAAEDKSQPIQPIATEPDLSALKSLDVALGVKINGISAGQFKTENVQLAMTIRKGIVSIKQLNVKLYQGQMNLNGKLDTSKTTASYQFEQALTAVQIRPLLMDLAEVEFLAGTANFSVKGTGQGLAVQTLKQNLLAQGQFNVIDGALYGVNIPQMLRTAQAKLGGDLSATDTEERKTDFSSLTGSFSTQSGIVTNPDFALAAPLIRLQGAGTVGMLTQEIDYRLTTRVVGSLSGQEAQAQPLNGIDIPFRITGTVQEPKFGLDTSALLDAKLKQETEKVKEKVKDKLTESLLERLGGQ